MKWTITAILKHSKNRVTLGLLLLCVLCCRNSISAQVNYVPNPGFEDLSDCDLEYGEIYKAAPWKIVEDDWSSPDLFHACSSNAFWVTPIDLVYYTITPKSGDGMGGLVNLYAEERIYARLTGELPQNIDIYVAYSLRPREVNGGPNDISCYSNSQSLAFSDFQFQSQTVILSSDTILDNYGNWVQHQTCYRATGNEDLVLLGNYKLTSETLKECGAPSPQNFSYYYVDDVIVSPFDVVPDTLFICGDELVSVDASFYEVPIQWSDGWQGPTRLIEEGGYYVVMGDVGDCFLTDRTLVVVIPDETETFTEDLCAGGEIELESPFPAIWENGTTSNSLLVNQPGTYIANLQSSCGDRLREYIVEETTCAIDYYVPNAFSPNGDGVNDEMEFFFQSEFEFTGDLSIFDRWGNVIFNIENVDSATPITWDGTFNGKKLNPAVFVWIYQYVSGKDGVARVISGNFTLLR